MLRLGQYDPTFLFHVTLQCEYDRTLHPKKS
jgi:hypothetical protein